MKILTKRQADKQASELKMARQDADWLRTQLREEQQRRPQPCTHEREVREFIERCGPLDAEKMLRAFAVPQDQPLLLGVMAVEIGLERIAEGSLEQAKMPSEERHFYAGWLACAREAQDKLAKLVQQGNAAVDGTKPKA